jgi:spermidine synthase
MCFESDGVMIDAKERTLRTHLARPTSTFPGEEKRTPIASVARNWQSEPSWIKTRAFVAPLCPTQKPVGGGAEKMYNTTMTSVYLSLLLLSAAMLAFEVALTRVFALAQGHHFAFMAVSLALLGAGASGTFLSLRSPSRQGLRRWLAASALLFSLTVPASYLAVNALPFDAYRIAWERVQLLWLALYYLALTAPFFFSGLAVGAALVARPLEAPRVYGANLFGSGLGPPLALLALAAVGGPGTVFGVAWLGSLAFLILVWRKPHDRCNEMNRHTLGRIVGGVLLVGCGLLFLFPPALADIRLTPYQSLSQALLYPGSRIAHQKWNAFSRVDVIESQGVRSAPGLSMAYPGGPPPQVGLTVDGQNLSPITTVPPSQAEFTDYLPAALAYRLRPEAEVLVVEPGGGLAVLTALRGGARSVTAVHSNPAVAAAVEDWGRELYQDPRVTVVLDDPRSFLRREDRRFDVIVLPLTDSFRPVTAGAYALGEEYRYTVEAFAELYEHLGPDGLLVAERWLQLPPTESLRLWGIAVEALRRGSVEDPGAQLIALRSFQTSLVIASREPFSAEEVRHIGDLAAARQYDLVWIPGLGAGLSQEELSALGVNRYNVVSGAPYYRTFAGLLEASDPSTFYADYPYAVAPPTDDHPFFFHFFKWGQTPEIIAALGRTWQPFGGSGYLVLFLLLALVLALSAVLMLVPLAMGRISKDKYQIPNQQIGKPAGPQAHGSRFTIRYLLYFLLLGVGFLFVEIPLLQRFIVYLGQPAYAFATVVGALLVASGMGSRFLAERIWPPLGLTALAVLVLAYPLLIPPVFQVTFGLPLAGRIVVTALALAPLGLLMGTPFPQGLAVARRNAPGLLPWIWAVNGCASVVSAVLAPMVAISLGFQAVMLIGAGAYLGAMLSLGRLWGRSITLLRA